MYRSDLRHQKSLNELLSNQLSKELVLPKPKASDNRSTDLKVLAGTGPVTLRFMPGSVERRISLNFRVAFLGDLGGSGGSICYDLIYNEYVSNLTMAWVNLQPSVDCGHEVKNRKCIQVK